MITRVITNVNQFTDPNINFENGKPFFLSFGAIYTSVTLFFGKIIANPFFGILLSLIILHAILYLIVSMRDQKFDLQYISSSIAKILMYMVTTYVCMCLEALPFKLVGLALANAMYSVLVCAECTLVMKVTADLFKNKRLNEMADKIDETADKFFPGGD